MNTDLKEWMYQSKKRKKLFCGKAEESLSWLRTWEGNGKEQSEEEDRF